MICISITAWFFLLVSICPVHSFNNNFGLKNAPAEFQRMMDHVLFGLPFARCYIDDVIIFSKTEHVRHLQAVFERLRRWGLRLHQGKCKFFPCPDVSKSFQLHTD
jgi:hypothetical protein